MKSAIRLGILGYTLVGLSTYAAAEPRVTAVVAPFVVHVVFRGNRAVATEELAAAVHAEETTSLDELQRQLSEDAVALSMRYGDNGYLAAVIGAPELRLPAASLVEVVFPIEEGPCSAMGEVTLVDHEGPLAGLVASEGTKLFPSRGHVFQRNAIVRGLTEVRTRYQDAGYVAVDVRTELPPVSAGARVQDVRLVVERGSLMWVDRVDILGAHRVPTESVQRLVRIRAGALYSETALAQSLEAIRSLDGVREANGSFKIVAPPDHAQGASRGIVTIEISEGQATYSDARLMFEAAQSSYAKGDLPSAWASARKIERLFLYSKFATQAEMLVADIDFDLRSFERAATEYDAFAIHHPSNPATVRARQKAEEARAMLRSTPTRSPNFE